MKENKSKQKSEVSNKKRLKKITVIQNGGGDSHIEQTGMLVGNFEFVTPRGGHLGMAQAFCDP